MAVVVGFPGISRVTVQYSLVVDFLDFTFTCTYIYMYINVVSLVAVLTHEGLQFVSCSFVAGSSRAGMQHVRTVATWDRTLFV